MYHGMSHPCQVIGADVKAMAMTEDFPQDCTGSDDLTTVRTGETISADTTTYSLLMTV